MRNKGVAVIALVLAMILFFSMGWIANNKFTGYEIANEKQKPLSDSFREKNTPSDWISEDKIKVYSDKVILDLKDAEWAEFANTHSMEPLFGANANGIEIKPKNESDVKVGDIVAYKSDIGVIIHRVVEKGFDDSGAYFILKGDGNEKEDSGKIRFEQIKGVLVGIIY